MCFHYSVSRCYSSPCPERGEWDVGVILSGSVHPDRAAKWKTLYKGHHNPLFNLRGGLTLKEVCFFLDCAPRLRSEDRPSGTEPGRERPLGRVKSTQTQTHAHLSPNSDMTQNRAIKYNKPKCPGRQRSEDTDIPRHAVNCTAKQKTKKTKNQKYLKRQRSPLLI